MLPEARRDTERILLLEAWEGQWPCRPLGVGLLTSRAERLCGDLLGQSQERNAQAGLCFGLSRASCYLQENL